MEQESVLRIGVDSRPGVRGLRAMDDALAKTGGKTTVLGKAFRSLEGKTENLRLTFSALAAQGISRAFSGAVSGVSAMIGVASDFEAKMAEVSTLVNTASFDVDGLAEAIQGLSAEFGQSAVTQVGAAYQIVSAGASSATEAIDILTVANRLATGGITDVATAADGLTSVLNAYGLSAADAADVSDTFFVGMRAGKTTIGELASSLGRVAPFAAKAGVNFQELVGTVAALTKSGVSTNEAITGTRAILSAVVKPSSEAARAAADLQLNFSAAAIESQGLAGFLRGVVDATGGSTAALAQLFGGVEALVPVLSLAGQAGVDLTAILADMETRGGATADAVAKMTDSFAYQAARVRESFATALIGIGGGIATALTPVLQTLADHFDAVTRGATVFAGLMTTALVPALVAAAAKVAALSAAFLLTPFGKISLAITAASAAIAAFGGATVQIGTQSATVWQALVAGVTTVRDGLASLTAAARDAFAVVAERLASLLSSVSTSAGSLGDIWDAAFGSLTQAAAAAINGVITLFVGLVSAARAAILDGIPAIFSAAMTSARQRVVDGAEAIVNSFASALGSIGSALAYLPGVADDLGDSIRAALAVDFGDPAAGAQTLGDAFSATGDSIRAAFAGANRDYVGRFAAAVTSAADAIRGSYADSLAAVIDRQDAASGAIGGTATQVDALAGSFDRAAQSAGALATVTSGVAPMATPGDTHGDPPPSPDFSRPVPVGPARDGHAAGGMADGFLGELQRMTAGVQSFEAEAGASFGSFFSSFSQGFSDSVGRAVWQTADLGESLKDVARRGVSQLISSFVQLGVQMLANKVLGITLGATATAASAGQAAALAAAWSPAAALASLATSGGNAAGASAAIASTMGLTKAMAATGGSFADGGLVRAPGSAHSDQGLAAVSNGEYIVRASATRRHIDTLEAMNSGRDVSGRGAAVTLNIATPDADSFRASASQIEARMIAAMRRADRRNR